MRRKNNMSLGDSNGFKGNGNNGGDNKYYPNVYSGLSFYNDESAKTKKLVKELMKANGLEKEFDLFLKGHCAISSYFAKILDIATGNENFYQNAVINYLNYRSTILEQLLAKRK